MRKPRYFILDTGENGVTYNENNTVSAADGHDLVITELKYALCFADMDTHLGGLLELPLHKKYALVEVFIEENEEGIIANHEEDRPLLSCGITRLRTKSALRYGEAWDLRYIDTAKYFINRGAIVNVFMLHCAEQVNSIGIYSPLLGMAQAHQLVDYEEFLFSKGAFQMRFVGCLAESEPYDSKKVLQELLQDSSI